MSRIQTILLIIAVSGLAAAGGFGLQQWLAQPPPAEPGLSSPQSMVGQTLPDFSFITLAGDTVSASQFAGNPLVINLWATWCGPCRKEMPDLEKVAQEVRDSGTVILGVALDQPAKVAKYLNETPVSYPIALTETAEGMAFARSLGNRQGVLPYTVFVDASGTIREIKLGIAQLPEIRAQVARLMTPT
ncbi:MAG: TlpA family protein disulfide reductase [Lysobacterales bacterium]